VPGGLVLILVILTVNVLADGPLVGADQRIRAAVQAQAASATWRWLRDSWHAPAQLIVDLGNYPEAVGVLAACAVVVAARHRTLRPLLAAFAAVVLLLATVIPAKILIGRTGPGLATVGSGGLGVFPSGHAATAAVCWGVAVMLLLPDLPAWTGRAALAAVAGLCLLVGVALVWCDYHWVTDVVAGWALAGLIAAAAARVARGPLPLCWLPRCWLPLRAGGRG
jgi:undecaprenyl-diphosphatase